MGLLFGNAGVGDAIWTVSELTQYIRELFEIDYRLQDIEVTGEISNFTQARSGHLYFTLKDDRAQLKCVMWRSAAERLRFAPGNGDAILARGRVSVYEVSGVYQLYAEWMEPAGKGSLALAFERLKQQLADEGLFDTVFKKPLPAFPHKIGVVTSADGAALRDILNVLRRRCSLVSVLVAPTLVQGGEAPAQIVRALQWLDGRDDIDVIILARGGGSIEDLWAFNDEGVARAIFAARHPIISGVGHETDFTIADFVADARAPTPSAAAEVVTPDLEEIRPILDRLQAQLSVELQAIIEQNRWQVQALTRALSHLSPQSALDNNRQRVDALAIRLDQTMYHRLERERGRLAVAQAGLMAISPLATLSRGYAIVRGEDGRIIRSVQGVAVGDKLTVQVTDGEFGVQVDIPN
jgi:exodeoxyribonuclease VII large subunit